MCSFIFFLCGCFPTTSIKALWLRCCMTFHIRKGSKMREILVWTRTKIWGLVTHRVFSFFFYCFHFLSLLSLLSSLFNCDQEMRFVPGSHKSFSMREILVMSPLLREMMTSSENWKVCPHKKINWQGKRGIISSGILCVYWWRVWYEIMSVIEEFPFNMEVAT
jgi:hypothetical protein